VKKILKGNSILVTAGPTWVPIDRIRIITNIFTGTTGYNIARYANGMGARVTLLLGPGGVNFKDHPPNMEIINFRYFDEFLNIIRDRLKHKKYDIIIHSASVSDYIPIKRLRGKISSGKKNLLLRLKPTPKITDRIKVYDPSIYFVKFKLEIDRGTKELINIAFKSLRESNADLIVANTLSRRRGNPKTFIIDPSKNIIPVKKRNKLPEALIRTIIKAIKYS